MRGVQRAVRETRAAERSEEHANPYPVRREGDVFSRSRMAKHEIPSFLAPHTHVEEIAGRTLRFYPISAKVLFRLRPLAGLVAKAVDAYAFQGEDAKQRQGALADLVDAIGQHGELAATVVLDALHDEEWVQRPANTQTVSAFFERVDGPTLAAMLAAVATVNGEAFGPLFKGVTAAAARTDAEPETAGTT